MKRKINITIEIDDNDYTEFKLSKLLNDILGKSMIDYRVFANTEHLKDNKDFKKFVAAKKKAGLELDRFINNNRD